MTTLGKLLMAFFVVYFVWGSTFLAIRLVVQHADPLLLAALRFVVAGLILLAWALLRGEARPSRQECLSACITATLMFGIGYGALFWAEREINSGIAALVVAMIPVWVSLMEILFFGVRPTGALVVGLIVGVAGITLLIGPQSNTAGAGSRRLAMIALLCGSLAWSFGTLLQQRLRLPKSLLMRSAVQMSIGGLVLALAAAFLGRANASSLAHLDTAGVVAMAYLILVGSVLAFSCYLWLLERVPASKVATYAFVNPLVAVLLGSLLAGEHLVAREWIGGATILAALAFVLSAKATTARARA